MIKPHEVRYGNVLKSFLTGEIVEVDWFVLKQLQDGNRRVFETCTEIYATSSIYAPILLTEKELINLGFFYMSDEDFSSHHLLNLILKGHFEPGFYSPMFSDSNIKIIYKDNQFLYCTHHVGLASYKYLEIKTVHQLQNLFYAISGGEELRYNHTK